MIENAEVIEKPLKIENDNTNRNNIDNNSIKTEYNLKNENPISNETDDIHSDLDFNDYEISYSTSSNTKCIECKKTKSTIPKVSLLTH